MKKAWDKFFELKNVKNFINIIKKSEMRVLPGSIAFFIVMSIVPALLLIAIFCAKFSVSLVDVLNILKEIIPESVQELLNPIITNIGVDDLSWWYVIIGIILASNGTHSIILASNALYGIQNKNYFSRRIKALVMILAMSLVFIFILIVIAFGNNILKFFLTLEIFDGIRNSVFSAFIILKWPMAILIISLLIKVLYTLAPDKKIPSKYVNKGVLFTTVGWVITTAIYSYYANNIANYTFIYGSLSSLIVLMIWIYVISYILVIGIAINTNMYELNENKT